MEQEFYFKGIGRYNSTTGKATYYVILPKLEGLTFHFDTEDIRVVIYKDKKCLLIYTQNGKDNDNYGTTPEIVQIEFTVPNVQDFKGKEITVIIKHDDVKPSEEQKSVPTNGGKPGTLGAGVIRP
jgi:hypothetical protein